MTRSSVGAICALGFLAGCSSGAPAPRDAGVDGGREPLVLDYTIADGGALQLSELTPINVDDAGVYGPVTATSPSSLYLSDGNDVQHFDGSSWRIALTSFSPAGFRSVLATSDGWVFAVNQQGSYACQSNCSQGASWQLTPSNGRGVVGLCGRDHDHVYEIGDDGGSTAQARHYNPSTGGWDLAFEDTRNLANYWACTVADDGVVFVASDRYVTRWDPTSQKATVEDATPSAPADQDSVTWFDIVSMGDSILAVGTGKRIALRSASGQWKTLLYLSTGTFFAAAPLSATAAVIGGTSGSTPGLAVLEDGKITFYDALDLASTPAAQFAVFGISPADANSFFVTGARTDDSLYGRQQVFRVTR